MITSKDDLVVVAVAFVSFITIWRDVVTIFESISSQSEKYKIPNSFMTGQ